MSNERIYYSREAEMAAMRSRSILTLTFLVIGLTIGAILALLFATDEGKNTRKDLVKGVEEGLNTGRETLEPMVKQLEDQFNDLKKSVEDRLTK
jgi:gas vesicle protein